MSKFDDSRSMFVYVIRHTASLINICSVPMYTSVCPNRYQLWYTLGQKNKNFISIFLKIGCYEDLLNAS